MAAGAIRFRLLLAALFGAVTALAVLATVIAADRIVAYQESREAQARLAAVARRMAGALDRVMYERLGDLLVLSQFRHLYDSSESMAELREALDTVVRTSPRYAWIGFARPNGQVVAAAGGVTAATNVSELPWFVGGLRGMFVGEVNETAPPGQRSRPQGVPGSRFVTLAVPVYDSQDNLLGTIGAYVDWRWAEDTRATVLSGVEPEEQIALSVVSANGNPLLGAAPPDRHVRIATPTQGMSYYPGHGWSVVASQPADVAYRQAGPVRRAILWAGSLIVMLAVAVGWFVANRVTGSLRSLESFAAAVADGRRDAALPSTSRIAELAVLTDALGRMTRGLTEAESHLTAANRELEREVAARVSELADSSRRLAAITANLPGVVYRRVRAADGTITLNYISEGAEAIFGYSAKELMAHPALAVGTVHPEDFDRYTNSVEESARLLSPWELTFRIVGRDRLLRWVHGVSRPSRAENGEIVWDGVLFDVTQRRRAEEQARVARERLYEAIESVYDGLLLLDADDRIVVTNSRFRADFAPPGNAAESDATFESLVRAGLQGQWLADPPPDRETAVRERMRQHRSLSPVPERRLADGRWLDTREFRTHDGGTLVIYSDVTERKQRERLLLLLERVAFTANAASSVDEAVEATLREVCGYLDWPVGCAHRREGSELVSTALWYVGDPARFADFQAATVNLRTAAGVGLAGRALASRSFEWMADISTTPEFRRAKAALAAGLRCGCALPVFAGGEVFAVLQFFGERVTEFDGRLTPVLEFVTAQLGRVAERQENVRMKNEFVSTVSHELRTPLTSIAGALELLDAGVAGNLPAKAHEMVAIAFNNSQRLVRLINDLLDMEKIEAGSMRFDVRPQPALPLIKRAIDETASFAATFDVTIDLAEAPPEVSIAVDSDRFIQIVTNLLSNAIKFSPPGGHVTVTLVRGDRSLRISVADLGPGIPEEFRKRLFEKFAQADSSDSRRRGGTGLGLAIVRSLVERLGGKIEVETELGRGTIFHVDLPLAQERDAA